MMRFGSPRLIKLITVSALVVFLAASVRAERAIIDPYVGEIKAASLRRTHLTIQGQPALVIEKLHSSGRVLARLVSWSDHLIIAMDHYGQGNLDTWEMFSNEAHVRLWAPAEGQFHLMDVDTFKGPRRVHARFARAESGDFELIAQASEAAGPQFEEVAPGGPATLSGVETEESTEAPIDVKSRIKAVQEKSLGEAVGKIATGCSADAKEKLTSGVTQVLMSDAAPAPATESGGYLRCLRTKGFEPTANAIASRFFSTSVPENSAAPTWSLSCQKCDGKSQVSPLCSTTPPKAGAFVASGQGGRPEMALLTPSQTPATTFFHESLHAAGIGSEKDTAMLTQCCGQGGAQACKDLGKTVAARDRAQVYLSAYFSLPARSRQKLDQASRQIVKSARAAELVVPYLTNVAEAHQSIFEANRTGACKDETSDACQALLRDSGANVFEKEVAAKCPKTSGNQCQKSVAEFSTVLGIKKSPEGLNLADSSRLIHDGLLARGPVSYHQLPVAQMAQAAARAGQEAAQDLPPSGGSSKAVPYRGPQMVTFDMLHGDRSDRLQVDMADFFGKQTGVVNSIVSRVARIASSLLAAVPLQASHVPDPTAVHSKQNESGMSAHLKKVLTAKNPAAAVEVKAASVTQLSPAEERARETFIKQMTSVTDIRLKTDLNKKETQKTLSDYNIGVIDQNGARHDHTANPTRWLIFDEESGRLQFLDADDGENVSK